MGLFTVTQAAERLGITRARVLYYLTNGRLNGERLGSIWVIKENDLQDFEKSRKPAGWPPGKPRKITER